jgi:hypothetical protein
VEVDSLFHLKPPSADDSLVICKPDDILRCSLPKVYQDPSQLPSMFEMVKVTGNEANIC